MQFFVVLVLTSPYHRIVHIWICFTYYISADTTGTESIYTVYEGHEIMFHISAMLPYSKENKQQVSPFTAISFSFLA